MENEPIYESQEDSGNEIAEVLRGYGEEHGFDAETCEEIAAMPFPEAFETAYSYLTSAGLDADTVLACFMQEPEEL
jgi:hypothetical protein